MDDHADRRGQTQRLPHDDSAEERGAGRRTERFDPDTATWSSSEPINPGWRRERISRRQRMARGPLSASPQEFQLWLQAGGWRYIAGIALLAMVLLIAMLALGRGERREAGVGSDLPATASPALGTAAVGGEQALIPTAAPTPTAEERRFYVVTGTGGQGLFLRPEPSTSGAPITTLPDGTRLEEIGPAVPGGDYLWRRVRTPEGQEGYVAADYLTPAP